MDLMKFISFFTAKETKNKIWKDNLWTGRKYLQTMWLTDKGLLFKICKQLIQLHKKQKQKQKPVQSKSGPEEFLPQQEMNLTSIHEDAGSIPGITQWVKDLALQQVVVSVADAAWICHCYGCGVDSLIQPLA